MATLAEIRAKLLAAENRSTTAASGDNQIFAHWNIPECSTSKIRFLPDGDNNNSFFWVERSMIRLPFAGIKGQAESKPVTVSVPCMEMYNEPCPILAEVRPWFKDKNLEEMGRRYWKKRSYLFQGLVRESSLKDDRVPENPIRRFVINAQIFNIIKAALLDPEIRELPTHYENGLDFQIIKTSKGGYSDYTTSKWSRHESALTAVERAAIDNYGLFNLAEFLPKKPTEVELKILKQMFEDSVDGKPYDADRYSQYYKPSGFQSSAGSSDAEVDDEAVASKPAPKPVTKPAPASAPVEVDEDDSDDDTAVAEAPVKAKPSSQKAEDILAMIRNRPKQ